MEMNEQLQEQRESAWTRFPVLFLTAFICCVLWGSASPAIKIAYQLFGIGPEEAVYIGDSEIDLQTAENAGLDVIAVTWGFRTEEFLRARGADVLVDDPMEILP